MKIKRKLWCKACWVSNKLYHLLKMINQEYLCVSLDSTQIDDA
ncbi:hypothetical protein HMPREF0023_0353 [Acinetobacter sp. ATCC 27244]|nr:hypothetical protein HMPREF0023_0353 [Acinetobacter sp. ATCC 27244]